MARFLTLIAMVVGLLGHPTASAVTRTWITFGNGNFNDPNNWFPAGVPTVNDFVRFEVGAGIPYRVTFPGSFLGDPLAAYTTSHLRVRDNGVTLSGSTQAGRGPSTYTVASTNETEANRGIIIGELTGDQGVLNISQPGIVCCGGVSSLRGVAATLGHASGSSGTLNVDFGTFQVTGSSPNESQLIVGNHGTGTLRVSNGADVVVSGFNSTTSLGHHATGSGEIRIVGTGATLTNSNQLWVGASGLGTVTIEQGGSLVTNSAAGFSNLLGVFPGSSGSVRVNGAGSTWTNSNQLYVGNSGNGQLEIENGGSFVHNGGFTPIVLGGGSNTSGSATITGVGSTMTTPGIIHVGSTGTGSLAVLNGGSVTSGSALIRGLNSGSGSVLVSGTGSTWNVTSGPLSIGMPEPGFITGPTSLTIQSGATVNVAQDIDLDSNGSLRLLGGTLSVDSIGSRDLITGQFEGTFEWTGGVLHTNAVFGSVTNQGGVLSPGQSAGRTTIAGNYVQQSAAAMAMEIGGPTPQTEHDFVFVEGQAQFNGALQLSLINGFTPTPQQTFSIFESQTGLSGAFSNVANGQRLATTDGLGSFLVHYGPGSLFDPSKIVLDNFLAGLLGDFNNDGLYNCADINALTATIAAGTNVASFDLTGDGNVNLADRDAWLVQAGGVNIGAGRAYRLGDANLDGVVDGSDFGIWNGGKFTANTAWCSGNFNGDTVVDGSDFGIWNGSKFTSSDGTSVIPEPTGPVVLCLIAAFAGVLRRRQAARSAFRS